MGTDRAKVLSWGGFGLAAAVLLILAATAAYTVFMTPVGSGDDAVSVRIERGSDLGTIAATLQEAGAITHRRPFLWSARIAGLERSLRSGDYEINPSWTMGTLLETLSSGRGMMLSVTLPEGMTLDQVARRLEAVGITDGTAFLDLTVDRVFLDRHGIPGPTAEGFLFPETYLFSPHSRPEDVAGAMFAQFQEVFGEIEKESQAEELGRLELVTLASIIEKESSLPEERPLVSAVFRNRLKRGYRLQSDPTVIYGIEDFDGNLTRADLEAPTPYNTYAISGLPPGPIANPGRGSLWAALNPARVDYLYFVSRNDGSHQFSRTLEEHNRAVRRYQLARRGK